MVLSRKHLPSSSRTSAIDSNSSTTEAMSKFSMFLGTVKLTLGVVIRVTFESLSEIIDVDAEVPTLTVSCLTIAIRGVEVFLASACRGRAKVPIKGDSATNGGLGGALIQFVCGGGIGVFLTIVANSN